MTEELLYKNTPKDGNQRIVDGIKQTFIKGTWYIETNLKNFSIQKRLRNYR